MVELELLQRRERPVALLDEIQPPPLRLAGLVEPVARRRRLAEERPRDEDDGRRSRAPPRAAKRPGHHARRSGAGLVPLGEPALLDRVGPHRDDGAADEDEPGEPDQVHERLHEHLEVERPAGLRRHLVGDREEVAEGARVVVDRHLVRDLLLDRVVVLARMERRDVGAAAGHVDGRADGRARSALLRREPPVGERVAGHLHRLAGTERPLAHRLVGARAGDPDREHDDGRVDDVAAVPAPVPRHEHRERPPPPLARDRAARRRAAHELEHDRRGDERGEGVREQARRRAAEAEREQHDAGRRPRPRAGTRNVFPSERSEARRHATSGPRPIRSSSGSPNVCRKKS